MGTLPRLVYTIFVTGQFEFFQRFNNWDWVKWLEGGPFHLRLHAPWHIGNVFGICSDALCRRVCQAVRAIVDCFLEAMDYWVDCFQLFFFTARTPHASVSVTAPGAGAQAWTGWLRRRYLRTTVCLGRGRRWILLLPALVARLHRTITLCLIFSIMLSTMRASGFELLIQCGGSGSWRGTTNPWQNLLRHWLLSIELFLNRVDH